MEDEEFINPNFIVTQKINQIGKVLNELKEKQSDLLINNLTNSQNATDYVKLELIKQQADQDARNFSQQIKIIQEENKDRVLFIRKPISSLNYQPENEKKYKKPTIQSQVQKLENTYKDLYFGSDVISQCLKEEEESLCLTKRRSNGSVLIHKEVNSYEYVYTNYQTNCLQGIQFNLSNRNLLSNHYSMDIKNQIEYNPLKKSSAILGLNKIFIDENEYLQVRSIYNLHIIKINEKKNLNFRGVESNFFQDSYGNYKELLDTTQSTFFEEELYVLAEGNSLFKTTDLGKTNQNFHLKNLKSNIESFDTSYHPSILYLQMTDCIGQFDFRQNNAQIIHQVPTKKVPLHRIYALKNLEENYFMVSTTQHFKIYDIRCTNYPVFSVMHGSDECPPTIINIYPNKNDNLDDNSEDDDAIETLLMQDGSMGLSKQRGTEKIIVSYSPCKKSDITYMRWNKGSTLLENLYEKKNQSFGKQNLYALKNTQKRDQQKKSYFEDDKSQQSDDINKYMFSQSKGNELNFQYLSSKAKRNDISYSNNDESQEIFIENSGINIQDANNESISDEGNKNLQKHHILGRENKGERLCFSQEVKNLFQPKSILACSQISDTLKIRGISLAFFDDQEKFICIQNDSKGGVQTQIFSRKNDDSLLTSTFVPIKAKGSETNSLVDISKSDPQLNSISDLQVMKLFEQPNFSDNYSTKGDLLTEPVRLSKQKKKQVNMYPYFNFLQDQVKEVKEQYVEEINKLINVQKEKKQNFQQQQTSKPSIQNLVNSQLSAINVAETVSNDQIKETIMEQNNLLSVYHDKYSYPEFRKNIKYNSKNVITNKIIQVLGDYWD
ncbi:hypothetical protein ABPG72_009225 [Tetrahymena utriculariae]